MYCSVNCSRVSDVFVDDKHQVDVAQNGYPHIHTHVSQTHVQASMYYVSLEPRSKALSTRTKPNLTSGSQTTRRPSAAAKKTTNLAGCCTSSCRTTSTRACQRTCTQAQASSPMRVEGSTISQKVTLELVWQCFAEVT